MNFRAHGREDLRPPADLVRRITEAGGLNLYGKPRFRIVWGDTELKYIGGKWEGDGTMRTEMRRIPRYSLGRWHVEAWQPPENYGVRDEWPSDQLGPFPNQGDYELVLTLKYPDGAFVPLSLGICDAIVKWVVRSRAITSGQRRQRLLADEEAKDKDWDVYADEVLDDCMPAFHFQPWVGVPSNYRRSIG